MIPYDKIPESLAKLKIELEDLRQLNKQKWVVLEKVHGANFSFTISDKEIRYAKRKESLDWESDFFGFQLIAEQLEEKMWLLFDKVKARYACDSCTVYGELFGGEYPHPQVPEDPRVQAVQTGVYYSPNINFFAFDLAVDFKAENTPRFYLDYEQAISFFEEVNLFHAAPLFIGSMGEAMDFDIAIPSTLPSLLGLPALAKENIIEGIIVKPLKEIQLKTPKGSIRPLLKLKNPKFKEDKRFHQAQKWSFLPQEKRDDLNFLLPEVLNFLTENRLQNTISKIGHLDKTNIERMQQIKDLLLEDTLESFDEEMDGLLTDLSDKVLLRLRRRLAFEVNQLVEQTSKE